MSASAAVVSCFLVTNTNATVSQKNRVQQQYVYIPGTFMAQSISYIFLYRTMAEEQKSVSLECSGKNLQISVVSIQNRFDTNSSSDITQKFRSIQNLQKPTLDYFSSF